LLPEFFKQHIRTVVHHQLTDLFEKQANQNMYLRLVESLCPPSARAITVLD